MSIDEQPMNVYWSGKRTETSNNFKTNYKGSVATKNNLPSLGNKTGDMYNVTESGENFVWNGNSWDSLSGDTLKTLNWQKTEKAGAVTCWPVGGTPLLPTVDFIFSETGPASGDKGPENPSTITGVESIALGLRSKNMFSAQSSGVYDGVSISCSADGVITLNGTSNKTAGESRQFYTNYSLPVYRNVGNRCVSSIVHVDGTYTLPSEIDHPVTVQLTNTWRNGNTLSQLWMNDTGTDSGSVKSYNQQLTTIDGDFTRATIFTFGGVTYNNYKIKVQYELTTDGIATDYEPSDVRVFTLPLGNTYYGGTLDLATGVMTVTWVGLVLDGTEAWSASQTHGTYYRYLLIVTPNKNTTDIACTHFVRVNNLDYEVQHYIIASGALNIFASQTTVEDFKAWLASQYANGTPVVVCYALATPQTVQLTPTEILSLTQTDKYTPRLNTIYTDASAVQVGYVKSPIRSEYELTQAIIATEGGE